MLATAIQDTAEGNGDGDPDQKGLGRNQAAECGLNSFCLYMRHPSPFSVPLHLVDVKHLHGHSVRHAAYLARTLPR